MLRRQQTIVYILRTSDGSCLHSFDGFASCLEMHWSPSGAPCLALLGRHSSRPDGASQELTDVQFMLALIDIPTDCANPQDSQGTISDPHSKHVSAVSACGEASLPAAACASTSPLLEGLGTRSAAAAAAAAVTVSSLATSGPSTSERVFPSFSDSFLASPHDGLFQGSQQMQRGCGTERQYRCADMQ